MICGRLENISSQIHQAKKPESEADDFGSLVSVQLAPEEFEVIETLAKSRGISPGKLIREWVLEHIEAR